jgi:hypothetical protein
VRLLSNVRSAIPDRLIYDEEHSDVVGLIGFEFLPVFGDRDTDLNVVDGEDPEGISQPLLRLAVEPRIEGVWPSRPRIAKRVPLLQVGYGSTTELTAGVRSMPDEQLPRDDVAVGDRVSAQNRAGVTLLVRPEVQATSGLPPLKLWAQLRLRSAMQDLDERFAVELGLHDITGLRDNHQPVVLLHQERGLPWPGQVSCDLRQHGRWDYCAGLPALRVESFTEGLGQATTPSFVIRDRPARRTAPKSSLSHLLAERLGLTPQLGKKLIKCCDDGRLVDGVGAQQCVDGLTACQRFAHGRCQRRD